MPVSTDSCIFGAWVAEKTNQFNNILDVGCGTGLLTLMLSQKNSAKITAIEIEPECYEQAKQNINQSPWCDRCKIINGDIKDYQFEIKFDFIISNPPFFENQLASPQYKKSSAKHAQSLSLKELAKAIGHNLNDEGGIGLLIPFYRTQESIDLFERENLYLNQILKIRQSEKHDYFRSVLFMTREQQSIISEETMTIKKEGQYSNEFIELMKDYYLYL